MASIFTKIITREIPAYIVAEDEQYIAFLDISPLKRGHTLVVPKEEVDYIYDLKNETLCGLHLFAKKVAKAIKRAFPCKRVGIAVVGLEVPHAHIHLIPIDTISEMNFMNEKMTLPQDELMEIATKIQKEF